MRTGGIPNFNQLLYRWAPASVLSVGPLAPCMLAGYATANPSTRVMHVALDGCIAQALEALSDQARFDVALVAGLLEEAHPGGCVTLISRLRDIYATRLFVRVEDTRANQAWAHAELVELGLQPLLEDGSVGIYGFDINAYKDTPDWLNAESWANPELWGKHRW